MTNRLRGEVTWPDAPQLDNVTPLAAELAVVDTIEWQRRERESLFAWLSMSDTPVKGPQLTRWGAIYGVKRRWFGLEPDRWFRSRLLAQISRRS